MTVESFLTAACREIGQEWVHTGADTRGDYGVSELPGGDRVPAAVVRPGSTAEVQALVRLANEHRTPLHPISTGRNIGLGAAVAVREGTVLVDLGARMNRILEFDETLQYVVVEPGVSYRQLYAAIQDSGAPLMCDTTSGPADGSPLGNTMDKGAGYTPAADHFGNSCGLEVVLGDARILRTGDGAVPGSRTWHLAKYGLGPFLDGLFLQSNYGIVTRMGIWLMRRPPIIRSFFFTFPEDEDLAEIADLARDLRFDGTVPTAIKATGDLYALAAQIPYPYESTGAGGFLPDAVRRRLHREHGIGAWIVSGAVYGAGEQDIAARLGKVREAFLASGKASHIPHEEAVQRPILKIHTDTYSGVPTDEEQKMAGWKGGGIASLTPSTPLLGQVAASHQRQSREILNRNGLDACIDYILAGRASRALHSVLFDRADPGERDRAARACRELREHYAGIGYPIGRAPADMQQDEMAARDPVFRAVLGELKQVLDPGGVLSPGRYGIG
ncbi:FAD-binding oxidoreductase [Sciscionella sediminilitoris]|uniref:FAD-binding oxidoreductase n=1 Tax=Sciscionella sediminilitoris TaxID=1445613 RepID=UPI0004DFA7AA|nr:FAD-binding oxidoreductase [Sciscionella sp. SE31]